MRRSLENYLGYDRPRAFKEILGHERWSEALLSNVRWELATGSHQPMALIGAPGTGKRTIARFYAQALLCELGLDERVDAAPCGVCAECVALAESSFGYVEIDVPGSSEELDKDGDDKLDLDEVQSNVLHTLIERDGGLNTASVRVVVFDNSEEFRSSAADIALKTLEQELSSSLYIFIVNDESRFSAALRSRCSVFRVGPISEGDLFARLSELCARRLVPFDEAALRAIASAAAGSFGEALAILARVERRGDVTVGHLMREPEFGWGPTMLACWRAVLGGRFDEALALFGDVGTDGTMRVRAMQAFLVECRLRYLLDGMPADLSASPALNFVSAEGWAELMREWAEWSRQRGAGLDEAIERTLAFWATVKIGASWRGSFRRGFEELTESRASSRLEVSVS
jgi:DNA polymerase III delta prime subunit